MGYGDFFISLKKKIDEGKYVVMTDTVAFVKLLDEVVLDYKKRSRRRNRLRAQPRNGSTQRH